MVQEEESAPAVLGDVPYMHRDRDDQRVSACSATRDQIPRLTRLQRFDSSMMNGLQAVPTESNMGCMHASISIVQAHKYTHM